MVQFSSVAVFASCENCMVVEQVDPRKPPPFCRRKPRGHLFAQIGTISGQFFSEMSSETKGPKDVLTSKGVSDVTV